MTLPPANPELALADAYVRDTGCNVFLTGKAGTGKTTFLHTLKRDSPKRLAVTAPTGVAAINAGGVTLHSFFQLPFGPFVPDGGNARSPYRFNREKIDIIKNLDLLVIDEISMVRADLLDGVDDVLRRFRRSDRPFGGVQLLMIGDLFQLPPVVREADWQLLESFYASPYFFSSRALQQTELVTIELTHIYRQSDVRFIDLLNRVRNAHSDPSTLAALNDRYDANFEPDDEAGYITLCTHNRNADLINAARLAALKQKPHTFHAEIEGDFPEQAYPTAASLEMKRGAQVMFVRNDPSPEKRYFNGKIGTLTGLSGKTVRIRCPGEPTEIEVEPTTWDNIEYALDRETQEIKENKIGVFKQFPLRLAWAVTIHKSQGLTFDRVIIDAQAAFAHGQVYVALSRCRTLEGIVLSTPLASRAIKTDAAVCQFGQASRENRPTPASLAAAKIQYAQRLLLECFDFDDLRRGLRRLVGLLLGHAGVVQTSGGGDIAGLQRQIEAEISSVGDKFGRQLQGLFPADASPTADPAVIDRLSKASAYFQEKLSADPVRSIAALVVESDNQAVLKKVKQAHQALLAVIDVKRAAVGCCAQGFSPAAYFRAISAAETDRDRQKKKTEPAAPTYTESDITHPALFQTLKAWRGTKAAAAGVPAFQIMHQNPLIQIAIHLPDTMVALKRIQGIGKQLARRYGQELLAMVADYRQQHGIAAVTLPDPAPAAEEKLSKKKRSRGESRQISLAMFEKGLSVAQIAQARGLVVATIEGHLAHFIASGQLTIDRLISPEKQQRIERQLASDPALSLNDAKQALGEAFSYGEIKLVQAHLKFLTKTGGRYESVPRADGHGDGRPAR